MQTRIIAVHPGSPASVDAMVAGVCVRAVWVGMPPAAGELVDVELDIDAVLGWGDSIAIEGAEGTLRKGPVLRGTVEQQEQELLILRVAEGLLQVEVDEESGDVPPGTPITLVAEHLMLYPTGL